MKLFNPPEQHVVIRKDDELTDVQMTSALRTSEHTLWYRAIVQLIDGYRETGLTQAAASAGANNPLAMAANVGAHSTLTELLGDLERRRASKG